jgi:hypothetical protein
MNDDGKQYVYHYTITICKKDGKQPTTPFLVRVRGVSGAQCGLIWIVESYITSRKFTCSLPDVVNGKSLLTPQALVLAESGRHYVPKPGSTSLWSPAAKG